MRSTVLRLGALLCLVLLLGGVFAAPGRAGTDVQLTYQGEMSSFRTTGSAKELFGNYDIKISWTESALVDEGELSRYVLKESPSLPAVDWTLKSLTGSVHQDQAGDPSPPDAEECTASFSPRPGFIEPLDYQATGASTHIALSIKVKAPFLAPAFLSSIEAPEGNFCTANAVHITGEQAHAPPESESALYAEYLAAYSPSLTAALLGSTSTQSFYYSHTFPNAPGLVGRQSTVSVVSSISVDDRFTGSPLSVEFPDGKPGESAEPIPLIEAPHFPHGIDLIPTRGKTVAEEEETTPRELEPVLGVIKGWKIRCPKALRRCTAEGVVTTPLALHAAHASAAKTTRRVIGRASVVVASGHVAPLKVRLTRSGLALLRARKRLACTLWITATAPGLKASDSRHFALILKQHRH